MRRPWLQLACTSHREGLYGPTCGEEAGGAWCNAQAAAYFCQSNIKQGVCLSRFPGSANDTQLICERECFIAVLQYDRSSMCQRTLHPPTDIESHQLWQACENAVSCTGSDEGAGQDLAFHAAMLTASLVRCSYHGNKLRPAQSGVWSLDHSSLAQTLVAFCPWAQEIRVCTA